MNSISNIRRNIFSLSQSKFGGEIGVNQSMISRWESGELEPSLSNMRAIRDLAKRRGVEWDDGFFWESAA